MNLSKLETQSLKIFRDLHQPERNNIIAFSGGKDSIVLYHLAKLSGLQLSFIYNNTTIDPPGHIGFIRKNFPDVEILQPKQTFYELIARYGLPTRHRRFCCQHLKEYYGVNSNVFVGVRKYEGSVRFNRLSALHEPAICHPRNKTKQIIFPLLNLHSHDVWAYIHENNLIFPDFYNLGFSRLGCIGCPLAYTKTRFLEFITFPRYIPPIIKAIKLNIYSGHSLSKLFSNEYHAFYWWLSNKSVYDISQPKLFSIDYQQIIKDTFKF